MVLTLVMFFLSLQLCCKAADGSKALVMPKGLKNPGDKMFHASPKNQPPDFFIFKCRRRDCGRSPDSGQERDRAGQILDKPVPVFADSFFCFPKVVRFSFSAVKR
jgi:hypothetical protein